MTGTADLFTPVHKGLRAMLYDLSDRLQAHDFADLGATKTLARDLENDFQVAQSAGCVLCGLAFHAVEEEAHIFPPAQKVGNGLIPILIEEHHDLSRREVEIANDTHALLELSGASERISAGTALNQKVNDLLVAYFAHMNREEVELVPLLRDGFTDAEQGAWQGAIVRSFPPDRMMALLSWMLPAMNVTELTEFMGALQRGAPPPVVKAVADLGAAKVDSARWNAARGRAGF